MRARKISPKTRYLYHYTLKSNVESILKDKSIRSRDDYVFFTGSLADSVKAFNNEIMTEGRPYLDLDGVLRYREKCDRKDYCILKIPYRDDDRFYRFDADDLPEDSIYRLAIAHRGAYDFKKARVLEMTSPQVARKEAANRKKSDGRRVCSMDGRRLRKIAAAGLLTGVLLSPHSAFADSLPGDAALDSLRSGSMSQIMQTKGASIANFSRGERKYIPDGSHKVLIYRGDHVEIDDNVHFFEYYEDYHIDARGADGLTARGTVRGSVSAVHESIGPDNIFGVTAHAETKGSAYVDVSENVSIVGEGTISALGIKAEAVKKSGYAEVNVGGNVTVFSSDGVAQGIDTNDGNVTVGGNISASAGNYAFGVAAMSNNQPARIMIKGGLLSEGSFVQGAAVSAEDEDGELTFSVGKGGITAVSKGDIDDQGMPVSMPLSTGLQVPDGSGKLTADIQGDISAQSEKNRSAAVIAGMTHSENHGNTSLPEGKQFVHVLGNLISDDKGIMFIESDYSHLTATDILVENEIQADNVGVLVYKHHAKLLLPENDENRVASMHRLNLTAWKIRVNENGNVAEYYTEDSGNLPDGVAPAGADRAFEKKINYIIRTEQPAAGGTIRALDADGRALARSHGFDVAHEGDKVILKADEGYQIVAAYNGKEKKTALSKDENGNFYLVVPKGGGVCLSAEVRKEAAPAEGDAPTAGTTAKVSGTPMARMTAKGRKSLTISWNRIRGAAGYDIFFAQCNRGSKGVKCRKVKTIKGNKTFSWTRSGLEKGTAYKAYVKAYVYRNGKKSYVKKSPTVHAYTGNGTGKYTNAGSVRIRNIKKNKLSLKKGRTFRIKASVKKLKKNRKLMPKSHAPVFRYMTSNKKIATVNSSGKITAKGKGSCRIYVYAHNGVSKSIKVTVPK